ncbi:MAG: tRNA glutamyl-Q(34) synthetase GluQRS [Rhizobiaceae bacterium]|nr:tRNA glutamyl-Q(34) synthetase GluQRS [Rhizobiaceae bacterium]
MPDPKRVFRFAPSPNGELHLGHAYSALLNLKLARAAEGKCLLRIEDIDTARCTPELEKQMLEDLEWIGFEWDEEPRRQSQQFEFYRSALKRLEEQKLLYPSILSRSEIRQKVAEKEADGNRWPRDPDGSPIYPGDERFLDAEEQRSIIASGERYALRLDMESAVGVSSFDWFEDGRFVEASPKKWGDVVLARKDTPTSYHLCCVMDDALQGVTDVVRGKDLYDATAVHVVLQELLGLISPSYRHHDLVFDNQRNKLSKSNRSTSLRALREAGNTAQDVIEMMGLELA